MGEQKDSAKEKRRTFEEWMAGDHVLVHLDSSREDVVVPSHLADNPALSLKLSYFFQGALDHDEQKISAELRFHGAYHSCVVPWSAIWGITSSDGHQKIWPEDLPWQAFAQLIKQGLAAQGEENQAKPASTPAEKKVRQLKRVK